MAVFTYLNDRGATGIIVADTIVDAAEVVGGYCHSDVVMRELEDRDYYGNDGVYNWASVSHNTWPWLVTREGHMTGYKYKICKRNDPKGTPWGDVEYSVKFIKEEAK